MIRAKYRVLNHVVGLNDTLMMRAMPVHLKHSEEDHDGSDENKFFYKATPAGLYEEQFQTLTEVPIPVGRCFYIDFEPNPTGEWHLGNIELSVSGRLYFRLERPWSGSTHGTFEAQIDNHEAVARLLPYIVEQQNEIIQWRRDHPEKTPWDAPPKMMWRLVLTPA
jgi:hypothetical protein